MSARAAWRSAAAALAPALLFVLACREPAERASARVDERQPPVEASAPRLPLAADLSDEERARELFARHCALCHGARGRGDGEGAAWLYPPARDFGLAQFRLKGGLGPGPSVEDLVRTLRHGMPGSAMPPFAWMDEQDLQSLAHLVLELAHEGLVERLREQAASEGEPFDLAAAQRIAAERLAAGEAIEPLPAADVTPALHERGREVYAEHCASCHGLDGKGRGGEPKRNEDGSLTWARDFTAGILKGGAGRLDLTRRIRLGMPGSSMPPVELPEDELVALVAYVQRLIPSGAAERHVQVRSRLLARRIEAREPASEDWRRADELELHTAPLAWTDLSVLDVRVAALHNGERVWLRLSWSDATRDDRAIGGSPTFDAAAVQLSEDPQPPLFGMGSAEHPVNIWHWAAASWSEVAGALDRLTPVHQGDRVVVDATGRVDARALRDAQQADTFEAQGMAHVGDERLPLDARGTWRDGEWQVTFSRALRAAAPRETDLVIGRLIQFGCAVWNGSAGDQRGQKSITIWHELELARE